MDNPQGLTGTPPCRRQQKGDARTGKEAKETGSWHGDEGANRDLGGRSRAAIK